MVRRVTPGQLQSMLRQAAQKQQRAIDAYNRGVRDYNAKIQQQRTRTRQAIDAYNREVRAHNGRVRANRQQLQIELGRLARTPLVVQTKTYFTSVQVLHASYELVERHAPGTWLEGREDILELAQSETANSMNVARSAGSDVVPEGSQESSADPEVEEQLTSFSPDLASRWKGALFALSPRNPDAARHFSTSAREILTRIIETEAPDDAVVRADPNTQLGSDGRPTRRARLAYCLVRSGRASEELATFADADIDNVLELFRVFNDGTHGSAGVYDLRHLGLIRRRVAGAIAFLHSILR